MRRLLALLALSAAACDEVGSTRPLLTSGAWTPEPGVWALLEIGCAAPTTPAVESWPECASPVWTADGVATVLGPVRSEFIVADGDPRILRLTEDDADGRTFRYYAVRMQGPPPHRAATVWPISCSDEAGAPPEAACMVTNEAELRRRARAALSQEPVGRAVYIGPA